jgi:hypothetical protein
MSAMDDLGVFDEGFSFDVSDDDEVRPPPQEPWDFKGGLCTFPRRCRRRPTAA